MTSSSHMTPTKSAERDSAKLAIRRKLLETMDLNEARKLPFEKLYNECFKRVERLLNETQCPLSSTERKQVVSEVMDEVFGLGPVEELLRDPNVSDILVNGPDNIYIEKFGCLEETSLRFRDVNQLLQVIQRIAAQVGRRIDESSPMLDARLLDGSRVNAIIPPLALDGPALSIRRFGTCPLSMDGLVENKTLTHEMSLFLKAAVSSRMNILISGGTGAGKTTFLNAMSHFIPKRERLITIEDAAELKLQREHVIRLETRPPNIEHQGEVTQRDLLRNSLRMRPDRIIIGEVRGGEALDMLQAMNTGHEGSMTTVHANGPRDALARIENMVLMAGMTFPVRAIRQQMASALDLLVHVARVTGGERKITHIAEIVGVEGDTVCLHDLFRYVQVGINEKGEAYGHFEACGVRPLMLDRMKAEGYSMPKDLFQHRILGTTGKRP